MYWCVLEIPTLGILRRTASASLFDGSYELSPCAFIFDPEVAPVRFGCPSCTTSVFGAGPTSSQGGKYGARRFRSVSWLRNNVQIGCMFSRSVLLPELSVVGSRRA